MELRLEGVRHAYGTHPSLNLLDLHISTGSIHAVMGPTGCGKTTALLVASLLLKPLEGGVFFDGIPVPARGVSRLLARRRTALVFQEPALFRGTVAHNAAWGLRARGLPRQRITERTREVLDLLNLSDLAGRSHDQLSGGERKRTALAAAVAVAPELLLLDEPFASTDPPQRKVLREHILAIHRKTGISILLATHDFQDALSLASRITVMEAGAVMQTGTPEEVLHHPCCGFTAAFAGHDNLFRVREAEGTRCRAGSLTLHLAVPAREGMYLSVSPGSILLSRSEPESSARNRFHGTVSRMEPFDYGFRVTADCAGTPISAVVTLASLEELALEPGAPVWVSFKVSAVKVYD